MKYTKGIFKDGNTGWKVDSRETNGVEGWEIHWSDDGECITDHVYTEDDAKLIAAAPIMYEALKEIENAMERWHHARDNDDETLQKINDILVDIGLLGWFNKQ